MDTHGYIWIHADTSGSVYMCVHMYPYVSRCNRNSMVVGQLIHLPRKSKPDFVAVNEPPRCSREGPMGLIADLYVAFGVAITLGWESAMACHGMPWHAFHSMPLDRTFVRLVNGF